MKRAKEREREREKERKREDSEVTPETQSSAQPLPKFHAL